MVDRDAQLDEAEAVFTKALAQALADTADDFANAVHDATELVAARFSVGRISRMWTSRVTGLVRSLLGVAETAATAAAEDADATLPDGWDDLPGRYDDERLLPHPIDQYVTVTTHLLRAVGDRLAEAARRELAAGVAAGEDTEQLRARLRTAFDREGAQLGPVREERVARTEASRAWNAATLGAARAMTGPKRPLVKQWVTRHDARVRHAHDQVDGQLRLVAEPFMVAGVPMQAPGDPTAPARLVVNCRCRLQVAADTRTATIESQPRPRATFSHQREDTVDALTADGGQTGAMIALIPTQDDAQRLALTTPGAEPAAELHLTLCYLGTATDWDDTQRTALIDAMRTGTPDIGGTIAGRVFGAAHWNTDGDNPSWVWSVGDDHDSDGPGLEAAHQLVAATTQNMPEVPAQHTPWVGHICGTYDADPALLTDMSQHLGPLTFDRLRIAFAGEYTDIPLGTKEEPMADTTAAAAPTRAWSTPDDTALAFENQETGDGRIFTPNALYWDGPGPWALQYAEEMLQGHEGAELAGAINTIDRDGDRIIGDGVLYPGRPAGANALTLLEEKAPLGISVDLDDVSIEFVDRTPPEEGDDAPALQASLASASVLRLDDGTWFITATTAADWVASGAALTRTGHTIQLITAAGGTIAASAIRAAFANTSVLTAAAGDTDDPQANVVHTETSGDFLLRITRARVRGATLVAMPAYAGARIVLDPTEADQVASATDHTEVVTDHQVVAHLAASAVPSSAREIASALGAPLDAMRTYLSAAVKDARVVRLGRDQYLATIPAPDDTDELVASAWSAMRDAAPMPAAWFREPTEEELPPGSGGVRYDGGRVYGWVAQAGEPHAGFPGRNLTIESLGRLDLSHFLRARFSLDDGGVVKAGAFTMNAPHGRDGAECETSACQFDDTRTVAGIVTVGMNARGLWFSGAAAPWLSEWDRSVFAACQPSYHMRQAKGGQWQLRAVLSVPVPGHSSPLLAAAVTERSNLWLAASAAVLNRPDTSGQPTDTPADTTTDTSPDLPGQRPDTTASAESGLATGGILSAEFLDKFLAALESRVEQLPGSRKTGTVRLAASLITPDRELVAAGHTTTERSS